ncbi:hypothetical protein JQ596_38170 [Bradyrhizobium manausense]|uniref:esterase/lipase family protein n=1 Tax=Bradyrhizobium manausense TaxID=989370 RepID=UPI001BA4D2C5|nr:hypothetical protein [Bradyrhizobium manausense]MBR0831349.1 hypothetical protein [Bradyrhizobium manausense]
MNSTPAIPAASSLNIILVHGTWGRGFLIPKTRRHKDIRRLRWFEEQSDFRTSLEERLKLSGTEAKLQIFEWSGANSVRARAQAASELGEVVASQSEGSHIIVIAHSHGGNVAMRALGALSDGAKHAHLVTLATPFMKVHPTWAGPTFPNYLFAVFLVMLIPFTLLFTVLLPSRETGLLLASAAFVSAYFSAFIVKFLINPAPKQISGSIQNTWPYRPFLLAEAANYPEPKFKMLVIKGVADEAALFLAAGKVGSVISRILLQLSAMIGVSFLRRGIVEFGVVAPLLLGSLISGWYLALFVLLSLVFFVLVPGILLGLAASVCMSFFGREFLLGCSRCEIEVDSAPDGKQAAIVTLPVTPFPETDTDRRGHSIYQHPKCVPTIADWFDELGILRKTPSLLPEKKPALND